MVAAGFPPPSPAARAAAATARRAGPFPQACAALRPHHAARVAWWVGERKPQGHAAARAALRCRTPLARLACMHLPADSPIPVRATVARAALHPSIGVRKDWGQEGDKVQLTLRADLQLPGRLKLDWTCKVRGALVCRRHVSSLHATPLMDTALLPAGGGAGWPSDCQPASWTARVPQAIQAAQRRPAGARRWAGVPRRRQRAPAAAAALQALPRLPAAV